MAAYSKAIRVVTLPFRAVWTGFLVVNFFIVAAAALLVGAFLAYWLALAFFYFFLPEVWTESLWSWASGLYAEHTWFKVSTIAAFALLLGPLLWATGEHRTASQIKEDEERDRRVSSDIAAQQSLRREADRRAANERSRVEAHKSLFG
ncbi:hypothetical protein CFBP4996_26295 (plasmid) [Agrobacterium leguminum]|uniref:hypothetical protein n=1 Tax=Agrobacterium leguminum TaxID=2792015 RepID=UPI0010C9AC56|nr:hypothetical protein [Agrobacterium leguminum]WFS69586.1 hypothetical protein CFBP4996_26295 [Agrobacterium leguminum]